MKTLQEELDTLVKMEMESDSWDLPPVLYVFGPPAAEHPDSPSLTIIMLALEGDPVPIVQRMGDVMLATKTSPFEAAIGQVDAIIMRFEGWGLKSSTPEEAAAVLAYTRGGGRISERDDKIETMLFYGVSEHEVVDGKWDRGTTEYQSLGALSEGRMVDAINNLFYGLRAVSEKEEPQDVVVKEDADHKPKKT